MTLEDDIRAFLREHARGRANARPRRDLRDYLRSVGRTVSDRALRRAYADIAEVGYAIDGERRGLFWITTKEEAKATEALRRSQGIACLEHAKESREAKDTGVQGELF